PSAPRPTSAPGSCFRALRYATPRWPRYPFGCVTRVSRTASLARNPPSPPERSTRNSGGDLVFQRRAPEAPLEPRPSVGAAPPPAAHRHHRRRYGSRTGRPRAPAAGVPPPGRRGGVWFRAPAAGAERVGAGTLHRVSVRVYLLQAAAGLLREAAHLLRVLLDVSHRHPRGSGRLVEPNPRRRCGPDLEPVPGGPRGAFRA